MELAPTIALILSCISLAHVSHSDPAVSGNGLRVGFYATTCPRAEALIQDTVKQAVSHNPGIAPGLIRLHFHDCFVRGCDGSVLLNTTPSGEPVEMTSQSNIGLRGDKQIEAAKTRLEAECPNTVSCADILAFAARDAAVLSRFPHYDVPAGRRDGSVSTAREAKANLPVPYSRDVHAMTVIFEKKGLSTLDLVALLGAHSVGRLHCKVIARAIEGGGGAKELGIDGRYAEHLRRRCPAAAAGKEDAVVSLNPSKVPLNRILSNKYYQNVVNGKAALMSDQALINDPETRRMVEEMANDSSLWTARFQASMVKMGMIDVLTGDQGQIRKSCGVVNR